MSCQSFRPWPWPMSSQVLVFDHRDELDEALAGSVALALRARPNPTCVLASGASFARFFALVRQRIDEGRLDFSAATFHHLDEFQGVAPLSTGSLSAEIAQAFFPDSNPRRGRFVPVDARAADAPAQHEANTQGRDLVLLGIGTNGHLAFNEPGLPFASRSHLVNLTDATRQNHAGRFGGAPVPARALTAGLQTILSGRKIILVATGASKASAVAAALAGPLDESCPASILRTHDDVTVMLDREAAASWRAMPALRDTVPPMSHLFDDLGGVRTPVVCVSPHPDDASISCGGLLARLPRESRRIIVTWTTGARAGEPGLDAAAATAGREAEASAEARILGAVPVFTRARAYDSGVIEPADVDALRRLLEVERPGVVLSPSRSDPHPTHRLCRLTVEEALRRHVLDTGATVESWTFEGPWCQLPRNDINVLVKLPSSARETKHAGILCHRSQVTRVPFQDGASALEVLRAITFSESDLGGRTHGGYDHALRLECYSRCIVQRGG